MARARAPPRPLPLQVPLNRLHEQGLPPEHRRGLRHRLS